MVTRVVKAAGTEYTVYPNGKTFKRTEYYGKSTDTKPTEGAKNNDIFYEMDTGSVFLFDEEGLVWIEQ